MFTLVITTCLIAMTPSSEVKDEDVKCFQLHSIQEFKKLLECEAKGAYEGLAARSQNEYFVRYFKAECLVRA